MPDDRVDDSYTTLWPLPCEETSARQDLMRPEFTSPDVSARAARCDSILGLGRNVNGTVRRSNVQLSRYLITMPFERNRNILGPWLT